VQNSQTTLPHPAKDMLPCGPIAQDMAKDGGVFDGLPIACSNQRRDIFRAWRVVAPTEGRWVTCIAQHCENNIFRRNFTFQRINSAFQRMMLSLRSSFAHVYVPY
jgi:hypothetical protein